MAWLWVFAASWVTFALSFGIGHAIIPSLVDSHLLPRAVTAARPVFYVVALVGVVSAVFALVNWVIWLQVLYRIFPRVVI